MSLKANVIMIGVQDIQRSKKFYSEGMGCELRKDFPGYVELDLGDRSSSLALYQWDAAAGDAGVPSDGNGFRGVSFHYLVASADEVDGAMAKAPSAGGTEVKKAAPAQWGGYFGYFADPDGHLWKIASS